VAILGGAAALVLCASVGAIIWVLNLSSASLDQTQRMGERRLLASVIENYRRTQSKHITDFTSWTELYEYLESSRDANWARENLGPYLSTTFGADRVFIADKNGRLIYSYDRHPERRRKEPDDALRRLAHLAYDAERPESQMAISGAVALDGTLALAAASTIRTSSLHSPSHYVLIEMHTMDRGFLGRLAHDYGIAELAVAPHGTDGLALATPWKSRAPFDLVWKPADAGHRHFLRALPLLATVAGVAVAAFAGLAWIWWRIAEAARLAEARIMRAELDSSRSQARAAEETSRSKSAFIANMSHELRTPLNAVIGFSELMQAETLGPLGAEKYRDYIAAIHSSGLHLLRVVNDILQVSRIEAGKFEPEIVAVDIATAVRDSLALLGVLADKRSIELHAELEPGLGAVLADAQALHQILINVIANAIKFSSDGSRVDIAVRGTQGGCDLLVQDHGCGIPADTLANLGKPFVQAEGTYSRKYQGTGLGLAVSFMLARAIDARIEIDSVEGEGTSVMLRLRSAQQVARAA